MSIPRKPISIPAGRSRAFPVSNAAVAETIVRGCVEVPVHPQRGFGYEVIHIAGKGRRQQVIPIARLHALAARCVVRDDNFGVPRASRELF